ncbi:Uncharacterized protein HZ326_14992 [Fusarium oxysporum f. sp. albedinis]|nr:Uncharacterized protein HZ326_14992 [Fusarium oxysporum f. sp. albedinis]
MDKHYIPTSTRVIAPSAIHKKEFMQWAPQSSMPDITDGKKKNWMALGLLPPGLEPETFALPTLGLKY